MKKLSGFIENIVNLNKNIREMLGRPKKGS